MSANIILDETLIAGKTPTRITLFFRFKKNREKFIPVSILRMENERNKIQNIEIKLFHFYIGDCEGSLSSGVIEIGRKVYETHKTPYIYIGRHTSL